MRYKVFFAALAATGLFLNACKKNDSYNAPDNNGGGGTARQTQLNYQLKTTGTSVGLKTTAGGTIQWTFGLANPSLIKFEATKDGAELELKSTNTAQIDLMTPVAAVFGGFTLPAGTYNEIELKIMLDKNGSSPALQLGGTYTSSSTTIPVSVVINEQLEVKTEQHNVVFAAGDSLTAITSFNLADISSGITEAMLQSAQQTNNTVVISASSNKDLYDIIVKNFKDHSHHCAFEDHH